jgi:exopolyphosphatase/guanosine-5'-triphosphate,3'-diphosphate pyrophosphatase
LGLSDSGVTPEVIEKLINRVLEFDTIADLALKGLTERRAQVWPGGLSILAELLSVLRIQTLKISEGALREGLLYDLLGRLQHEDARERTVQAMVARYHVDTGQAQRVAETAAQLYRQCEAGWEMQSALAPLVLDWSARLHEIGLDISHDDYQLHGAYIAENADMPGFPRAEQRLLAVLISSQRHNVDTSRLEQLPGVWHVPALRLVMLLRLAVLLNRSRKAMEPPPVTIEVSKKKVALCFEADWLAENPLTIADLEGETGVLRSVGYELVVTTQ